MPSTLQEAFDAIETVGKRKVSKKRNIADRLLGRFKGIMPEGKRSTEYVRELRGNLYGKISRK